MKALAGTPSFTLSLRVGSLRLSSSFQGIWSPRMKDLSRREALLKGGAAIGAAAIAPIFPLGPLGAKSPDSPLPKDPFRISLNTSTLRGFKLPFAEVIDIAGKAGYAGIEPWPDEIDRHLES